MSSVKLTGNFLATARCLIFADSATGVWSFNSNTNTLTINAAGGLTGLGNPTAKVGLTAVNGIAFTAMRSDGSPPIDQSIAPTWTALHTFGAGLTVSAGTTTLSGHTLVLSANATLGGTNTGDQTGANPSATIGLAAVNGTAPTFMTSDSAPPLSQAIAPTWTGQHTFTPASGYGWIVNGPANGAKLFKATAHSGGVSLFGYADSAGSGITNSDPQGSGVMVYLNGANVSLFVSGSQVFNQSATACTITTPLGVNGNSAPAKVTGWGTPTNQAVVANYNATTATLLQTADVVAQLITDLKAIGFYGA